MSSDQPGFDPSRKSSPPPSPPPPPYVLDASPGGGRWKVWLLVIAVVAGAFVALIASRAGWRVSPRAEEDVAVKHQETADAFAGKLAITGKVKPADIQALLMSYGQALRSKNDTAGKDLLDFERLAEELKRVPEFPSLSRSDERAFMQGLRQGMSKMFSRETASPPWHTVEIKLIKELSDNDAVVYTKLRCDNDLSLRMRWWVHKSDTWRVYDFEDLDGGIRVTSLIGRMFAGGPEKVLAAKGDIQTVTLSLRLIGDGQFDEADTTLQKLGKRRLPPDFEALRQLAYGSIRVAQERWDEALEHLDQAEKLNPDMPVVHVLRAAAYNGLDKPEQALESAERNIAMIGTSDLACLHKGIALEALERTDEAIGAYRDGLDDEPDSADCLVMLANVLPAESCAEEIGQRFGRSSVTRELFRTICNSIEGEEMADTLDAIVTVYRAKHGAGVDPDYFGGIALYLRGDHAGAAAAVQPYLTTTDPYYRDGVLTTYLDAMRQEGKSLEAYQQCGRPEGALEHLGNELIDSSPDEFEQLLALHQKNVPGDAKGWYWQGRLHVEREQFDAASQAYATAIEKNDAAADEESEMAFARARSYAMYRAGKSIEAYDELTGVAGTDIFDQLASLHSGDRDADGLRALIARRRNTSPDDPYLPLWDAEAHYLSEDYAAASALFEEHRDVGQSEDKDEHRSYFYADDRLVRCLVRLGRHSEALSAAQRIAKEADEDPYYLVLAHAAAGQVQQTVDAVRQCVETGYYDIEEFYADEDLAPILRSDAFAAFRAAHPEPQPATQPAVEPEAPATAPSTSA